MMISSKTLARALAGVSLSGLALVLAPSAQAQSTPEQAADPGSSPADDQSGLTEIVVIGTTKRLENTLDVPTAITAFSGETLETKGAVQVADVATFTPGFNITPAPGNGTAITLAIRGQVQTDILATLEPSVGTYVDELYWGRAYGLNAGLIDIASVQVLKGPQGTLFGRNTTGGALVFTTADPDPRRLSGKVAMTYGRYNEMAGEMVVNVPLGETAAVRGALKISHRDGWAYGVRSATAAGVPNNTIAGTSIIRSGKKYNDRNEVQGRVKALWEITPTTTLLVSGEWYDYVSDGPGRQLIDKLDLDTTVSSVNDRTVVLTSVNAYEAFFKTNPNAVGADAFDCSYAINSSLNCSGGLVRRRDAYTYANTETYLAKLTQELGFGTFKVIGGYRNVYTDNFIDLDGSGTLLHATSLTQDLTQKSIEAQLAGTAFADALEYVIGATYFKESGYDRSYSLTGASGNVPGRATRNYGFIDNDSIGVYSQLRYHIGDAFSVYGGLRYSEDKKGLDLRSANLNIQGQLAGLAGNVFPTGYVAGGFFDPCNAAGAGVPLGAVPANDCSAIKKAKFDSISWTAGVDFKPSEDSLLYAKISKGYRSGGQNLRAFNEAQFVPFQPETVIEEEVGAKGEFFDRRLRVTLAAYHNELSDAQRTTIVTTGTVSNTIVGNAAKVRNYGVEADVLLQVARGLTLSASGSYNNPKYLSYPDLNGTIDRSAERFQGLANKKFSLGANYDAQLGDISVNANADYSWTSSYAGSQCTATGPSACYAGVPGIGGVTVAQLSLQQFNATVIPSAELLNARLTFGFSDDMFKLSLWGKNLLNDRGYTQTLLLNAPGRNYVSGLRREPLTYGVTGTVTF